MNSSRKNPGRLTPEKGCPLYPGCPCGQSSGCMLCVCVCVCVCVWPLFARPVLCSHVIHRQTDRQTDRQTQTQKHTYTRTHPHPHTCVPWLPFLLLPNSLFRVPVQMLTLEVQCALPFHCRSWGVCIHSYQSPGQTAPAHPAARLHLGELLDAAPHEASPPPPQCLSVVVHLQLGGGVRRRATAAKFP